MNSGFQLATKYDAEAVKWKIRGHGSLTALAIALGAVFILRGTLGGSSVDEAGMVLAGAAGFAALVHLLLVFCAPIHLTRRHVLALLLVAAAPLAFLIPVLTRPANGWPLNSRGWGKARGDRRSRIIAPGEMVNIRWEETGIKVVDGHWRGTPQVEVLNAAELGCTKTLPATGRDDDWRGIIWSKHKYGEHPPVLSVRFRLPAEAAAGEQPLRARITMPISYPAPEGRSKFAERSTTVNREIEVVVAPSSVKRMYWASWWVGATLGLVGSSVGGFMLVGVARGLRARDLTCEAAPPQRSLACEVAGSH